MFPHLTAHFIWIFAPKQHIVCGTKKSVDAVRKVSVKLLHLKIQMSDIQLIFVLRLSEAGNPQLPHHLHLQHHFVYQTPISHLLGEIHRP